MQNANIKMENDSPTKISCRNLGRQDLKLTVFCHSRENGNPVINLDPRLRGDDIGKCHFTFCIVILIFDFSIFNSV